MCSGNKLRLKPAKASGISNGVYEVVLSDNSKDVESGVVREWAEAALPSSITSVTDFFYYVLPPNVDFGSAAAWAYLPGDVSTYFDTYASIYIVMMHGMNQDLCKKSSFASYFCSNKIPLFFFIEKYSTNNTE